MRILGIEWKFKYYLIESLPSVERFQIVICHVLSFVLPLMYFGVVNNADQDVRVN